MLNLVELNILESILSKNASQYKLNIANIKSTDGDNPIIPYAEACFNIYLKHDVVNEANGYKFDGSVLSSLLLQSLVFLHKNECDSALHFIDKCIDISPNFLYFYLIKANIIFLNSPKNGLSFLNSVCHRFYSNPAFLYNAALILFEFDLIDDSIVLLESLISLQPSHADAVLLLGGIYLNVNIYKGLDLVTSFNSFIPDSEPYLSGFSLLYYKYLGFFGSRLLMGHSLNCINRCLEINPLNENAIIHKAALIYHSQGAKPAFSYLHSLINNFHNSPQYLSSYINFSLLSNEFTGLENSFKSLDPEFLYSSGFYPLACKFYLLTNNISSFYNLYNKAVIFNDKDLSALVSQHFLDNSFLFESKSLKIIFVCSNLSDLLIFVPFLSEFSNSHNISLLVPENLVSISKSFNFEISIHTTLSNLDYDYIYHISSLPIILNASNGFWSFDKHLLRFPSVSDIDQIHASSNGRKPVLFLLSSCLSRPFFVTMLLDWISNNNIYPILWGESYQDLFSDFSPFFISADDHIVLISAIAYSHLIITDSLLFSMFCNLGSVKSCLVSSFDRHSPDFLFPDLFNNIIVIDVKFDEDHLFHSFADNILGVSND